MTGDGRGNQLQTHEERSEVAGDSGAMLRAESDENCHCSCHHPSSEDGSKEQCSPTGDVDSTGPLLIDSHTIDFAYHRPYISLDSPSPSSRRSTKTKNGLNAEPLEFPGINLTEAFLKGRAPGNDAKRSSAPAALGINARDLVGDEPQSIAQVISQDYALALQESALPEQETPEFASESTVGPSRLQRDARSKSYPGSQSYSSKLFELELSPIFEDSPVFGSTGNCILFEAEDSAGSQDIGKANAKNDVIVSDSSESSYGELIESKTFGCSGEEESSTRSPEREMNLGSNSCATNECSEEVSDSYEASQSDHLSLGGALQAKPWPVPSLTLTQPTPESTKSSDFLAHQLSVDRIVEDDEVDCTSRKDDSHSLRRVLEEVDPIGQRNCSVAHSTWLDTVESSVNTSEVEGPSRFFGGAMVDEHGSIVRGNDIVERSGLRESTKHQTGLSRYVTRDCAESVTTQRKKRWSLISSLKSRSTTTNGRSDRSGESSIWTRLSTVLSSTDKKTLASSLACSDDGGTLARPSAAGIRECSADGFVSMEKRSSCDVRVQEVECEDGREDEGVEKGSGPHPKLEKRGGVSMKRLSALLGSAGSRISRYVGIRVGRRRESKWEGKSIPPKMV